MAQTKYYYDPKTCRYERVKKTKKQWFFRITGFLAVNLLTAFLLSFTYITYFDSPKEAVLRKENKELKHYYTQLQTSLQTVKEELANLQETDNVLYRSIFNIDPLSKSARKAGVGGIDAYEELADKDTVILETFQKVDTLKNQLLVQAKSYDKLLNLAKRRTKTMAATPSIQPITNKRIKRLSCGYGRRRHPLKGHMHFHTGLDYAARIGTPVLATGDGVVIRAQKGFNGGFGHIIVIRHTGSEYITKYAHLSKIHVKKGQLVKRGDCIGDVGNTGTSTGPHLHYEVLKNRKNVNPIKYCFEGLTAQQYDELKKLAAQENQSLD